MRRFTLAIALGLVVAACSSATDDSPATSVAPPTTAPPTSTTTTVAPTTTQATTTTEPPTTTTAQTTTTAAQPPAAEGPKGAFWAMLDQAGWLRHTDPAGWSISYPPLWEVVVAEAGRLVLEAPDGGLFVVSTALDAVDDEGSADYLRKNVEFAVAEGMLREPDYENGPFWIDGNYDDVQDVHDLYGYELSFAIDPLSGEAVPAEYVRPVWQYGYYDPDAQPDLGFIFQAIGKSLILGGELDATALKAVEPVFELADGLVYSFEPGGGYPED